MEQTKPNEGIPAQVTGYNGWVYFAAAIEIDGDEISVAGERFRLALPVANITECRSVALPGISASLVITPAQIYLVLATFPEVFQAIVTAQGGQGDG